MIITLFVSFIIMALIGIPIYAALGLSSLGILIFWLDQPIAIIVQRLFSGIDSFSLMAIPFFVIAGNAMDVGGLTKKIVNFCNTIVGSFKGGLGLIGVTSSMFFSGVSGSAVADTSAVGGILIPAMISEKYDRGFATSLIAFCSCLGPIIPPSISMVVYGVSTGTSISSLFLAGVIPGIILGICLFIYVLYVSNIRNYPSHPKSSWREFFSQLRQVIWALIMPGIVLFGILFGIFTVTEASAVVAIYGFIVGAFVYKGINSWKKIYDIMYSAIRLVAVIMILIGSAKLYSWVLVVGQAPTIIGNFIFSLTDNVWLILLLLNIIFLLVGMFIEANAAIVIFAPIIFPLAVALNIDPVHLGIIIVFNLSLGLITPPVGLCLTLATRIGKCSLIEAIKSAKYLFLIGLGILLLITYLPQLSLFIPNLVGS